MVQLLYRARGKSARTMERNMHLWCNLTEQEEKVEEQWKETCKQQKPPKSVSHATRN